MDGLQEIKNDLFDISSRLKEINQAYRLFYNNIKKRYEVFAKGALQFVVPFDKLDQRTLAHAINTRIENADNLIEQISINNKLLEKQANDDAISNMFNAVEKTNVR